MLMALLGLWLGGIALAQFILVPLFVLATHASDAAIGLFNNKVPDFTTWEMRLLNMITQPIMFLLPPLLLARIFKERTKRIIGFYRRPPTTLLVLGFAAIVLCLPFIYMANEVNQQLPLPDSALSMEGDVDKIQTDMINQPGWLAILGNFLLIAVIAPVAEEVFFRGGMQKLTYRITSNPHLAIILSAAAFSAIHMEFAGFIPRMILGMILGYMAFWSGNILIPIFCHAVFNGGQLALIYMLKQSVISDPNQVSVPIYLSVFSAITTTLVLKQFYTRTIIKPDIPK
jgi:membrane protease YdiL (CAAX protease family)